MRIKRTIIATALVVVTGLVLAVANVTVNANDDEVITTTFLSGTALNGQTPKGEARYRTRPDRRDFRVQVENVNVPAGTALNVFVNGSRIGALTINSFRQGELERNTNDGHVVPVISTGTTVAVKTAAGATVASGTFGSVTTPSPDPGPSTSPSPSPSPGGAGERYVARFSASGYRVAENAGAAVITITRSGDVSRDAKVSFATADGTASSRTDYTVAFGRLFFAPGETRKSFRVPLTDDSLAEGSETFRVRIVEASNSGTIGAPGVATVTITDNDTVPSANPLDTTKFFVQQHYNDFLNREAEPAGLSGWSGVLDNCPSGDTKCDRIEVSSAFYRSAEFAARGYFIYRFYETAFGRRPTFNEFTPDMARLNGAQTEAEQEANKVAFINDFTSRAAFRTRFDGLTSTAFVDTLLRTAGVALPQRTTLINDLAAGRKTRARVLREIVESAEVYQKVYNKGFVAMEYFGYLRRDPDAAGYQGWLNYLDSTGDYRGLVHGFIYSSEYRQRFGP
jgi:hypothetical protein